MGGASGSKNPGANLHKKASLAWLACNERWNNGSLKLEISGIIANSEKQLFCFPEFALVGSMCEGDEIFVSEFVSENCDGFGFSAGFIVPSGSTAATGRLPLSLAQPAIFLSWPTGPLSPKGSSRKPKSSRTYSHMQHGLLFRLFGQEAVAVCMDPQNELLAY